MFYDEVEIEIKAGDGGHGLASFRREKYVSHGGPNGGSGGQGGAVLLRAVSNMNTLSEFRYKKRFEASSGGAGGPKNQHGAQADDLILEVPVGTIVRRKLWPRYHPFNRQGWKKIDFDWLADLSKPHQQQLLAAGGRGGMGNALLATSNYKAPPFAQLGEPGQIALVQLELKLLADVGLVGFPNAGKSTLISVISQAKPKIANYPFTTTVPQLGVVEFEENSLVVADIPGLIEGAHQKKGLGHKFLRHIERTSLLWHVVDVFDYGQEMDDIESLVSIILKKIKTIEHEMAAFDQKLATKKKLVVFNKIDLLEPDILKQLQQNKKLLQAISKISSLPPFFISAAQKQGLGELLYATKDLWANQQDSQTPPLENQNSPVDTVGKIWRPTSKTNDDFEVRHLQENRWQVIGNQVERIIVTTPLNHPEALRWLYDRLQRIGVHDRLIKAGVQEGDIVVIAGRELEWQ